MLSVKAKEAADTIFNRRTL